MGSVGADINAVEIVEKKSDGSVVDDFIVDFANQLRDPRTAAQHLTGVRVDWIALSRVGLNPTETLDG
jgi:hypothetical protein